MSRQGHPAPARVAEFFAAGYRKAALVVLLVFVATNSFNHDLRHLADVPVDFPAV